MKLLAVRHAIAEDISPTGQDADRPLSSKGRERFKQVCKSLNHLNLKFELLLDSPLLRSQQTADIFCKYFSVQKRETSNHLKPLAPPSDLLLEIESYNLDAVVIVGHQPFLTRFISYCVLGEDSKDFVVFKRGGMAFLEFPLAVQSASAVMNALLVPKHFIKEDPFKK